MLDPFPIFRPLLYRLNPERAHRFVMWALRSRLATFFYAQADHDPALKITLWGKSFSNPVGLAAGFDKNAVACDAALRLGFGFIEVGGVTPRLQDGNPTPRLFRLDADRAIINRMGFNSEGVAAVRARLCRRARSRGIVGVNLGKNKESSDAVADYAALAAELAPCADFLVINVSSPNTPGLRALQSVAPLVAIMRAARAAAQKTGASSPVPLLIKISPDLSAEELSEVVGAARAERIDGIVVSNTSVGRPSSLVSPHRDETGGLSGAPLFDLSTRILRRVYELTEGTVPLIGVGGVASGADAYAKVRAGASLVQLYSALVFEGPGLVRRIKRDLGVLLRRDGFTCVADAVGADHRAKGRL